MIFSTYFVHLLVVFMEVFVVFCDQDKPTGMKQGIYCECCSATVKEISKKLEKKTSDPWEVKVVEAMEDLCTATSFRSYDYSPPTTVKACKYLLENYDEDIEQVFNRKESDSEKKICYEISKACEGVDRSKKEKEDMDVKMNDQSQQPQQPDDGIQRMNVDINDPSSASRLAEQIKQQMAMQQEAGGTNDYNGDEDEDQEDELPEEDDGDEGNEHSVKKPQSEKKEEEEEKAEDDKADKEEDKADEEEESTSKTDKTEL